MRALTFTNTKKSWGVSLLICVLLCGLGLYFLTASTSAHEGHEDVYSEAYARWLDRQSSANQAICRMDDQVSSERRICLENWIGHWIEDFTIEDNLVKTVANGSPHLTASLDYNFPVGQRFGVDDHARLTSVVISFWTTDPTLHPTGATYVVKNFVEVRDPSRGSRLRSVTAGPNSLIIERSMNAEFVGSVGHWVNATVETVENGRTVSHRYWMLQPDSSLPSEIPTGGYPNVPAYGELGISDVDGIEVGRELELDTDNIEDIDGIASLEWLWYRWCGTGSRSAGNSVRVGHNSPSYTIVPEDAGCQVWAEVLLEDGHPQSETTSFSSRGIAVPKLTLSFSPTELTHNGSDDFTFQIVASEAIRGRYPEAHNLRFYVLRVSNGSIDEYPLRINDRTWSVTVTPDGNDDVSITIPGTLNRRHRHPSCNSINALCGTNGRALLNSYRLTVEYSPELVASSSIVAPSSPSPPTSSTQTFEPTPPPTSHPQAPPSAPGRPVANVNAQGHVSLTWSAPTSGDASSYKVLRRRLGVETFMSVVASSLSSRTFTDTAVVAGSKYAYRIVAVNQAGSSIRSSYTNIIP